MNNSDDECNARYADRRAAGAALADVLRDKVPIHQANVLALPRGGVPVAFEVAASLHLPLDVILVRKLGIPDHKEIAMGAIATGGIRYLDWELIAARKISREVIADVVAQERLELARREKLYRGSMAPLDLCGKQAVLVDDGLATGATMRVAIEAARRLGAAQVILAVPVAPIRILAGFAGLVEQVICPRPVENFYAVSLWYEHFPQTSDEEVQNLLAKARRSKELFEV